MSTTPILELAQADRFVPAEPDQQRLVLSNDSDPREADEIAFPTFVTGLRVAQIVDAIALSARAGGRWKAVRS